MDVQSSWKQQQIDAIADALHELLCDDVQGNDGAAENALEAIDAAIDSWLSYFEKEKNKWETLKMRLRL